MKQLSQREYVGDGRDCQYPSHPNAWKEKEAYIAPKDLANAVNIALYLRRPLLLEGDPGCGKTRLAHSVAYELGYPLQECYIRSTSRAQDFLYSYDAVRRLYDIEELKVKSARRKKLPPRAKYVTLGKLGEAIKLSQDQDIPSVVLIDEIDKADIDFPNDLLQVLDRFEFSVEEAREVDAAGNAREALSFDALKGKPRNEKKDALPLVIITSNREKELPKPFLRRCLFYYIKFPDETMLKKIIESHFSPPIPPLFKEAVNKFSELRVKTSWRKSPSTSELLDWVRILGEYERRGSLTLQELQKASLKTLPYVETLIKTQSDLDAVRSLK